MFEDLIKIDLDNITCHSGGAVGADTAFENIGSLYKVKTKAYSHATSYHSSVNKVEISEEDYREGLEEVNKANRFLGRWGIKKYMNLLSRNWAQVKYSTQIFAIGTILNPGQKTDKGYYSKAKYQSVDGGTGYSVQMGINHNKDIYVFDQNHEKWFRWSYASTNFIEMEEVPKITSQNFAGIGTRQILPCGIQAIKDVYKKTFGY